MVLVTKKKAGIHHVQDPHHQPRSHQRFRRQGGDPPGDGCRARRVHRGVGAGAGDHRSGGSRPVRSSGSRQGRAAQHAVRREPDPPGAQRLARQLQGAQRASGSVRPRQRG